MSVKVNSTTLFLAKRTDFVTLHAQMTVQLELCVCVGGGGGGWMETNYALYFLPFLYERIVKVTLAHTTCKIICHSSTALM